MRARAGLAITPGGSDNKCMVRGRRPKDPSDKARRKAKPKGDPGESGIIASSSTTESVVIANDEQPIKPTWLSKSASKLWDENIQDFLNTKTVHKLDSHRLADLFQWLARAIALEKKLGDRVPYVKHGNGQYVPKPEWNLAMKAWDHVGKIMAEFGVTSAARRRMNILLGGQRIADSNGTADRSRDPVTAWIFDKGPRPQ